jgi:nitrogen regulatory protein PII
MRLIVAIIRPFKFEEVKEALSGIGIEGMTVTEALLQITRGGTVGAHQPVYCV